MKTFYPGHTQAGSAMTELFLEAFRLRGVLIDVGDRISRPLGLTAARWQVLSYVARAPQPAPVAHMAREMGLTRQSLQRLADQLATEGLLEYGENPHHRRAPLVIITSLGKKSFAALTLRQVLWVNKLARGIRVRDIEIAINVMRDVECRLKGKVKKAKGSPKRRKIRKGAK